MRVCVTVLVALAALRSAQAAPRPFVVRQVDAASSSTVLDSSATAPADPIATLATTAETIDQPAAETSASETGVETVAIMQAATSSLDGPSVSPLMRTDGGVLPSISADDGTALITNTVPLPNLPAPSLGGSKVITLPSVDSSPSDAPHASDSAGGESTSTLLTAPLLTPTISGQAATPVMPAPTATDTAAGASATEPAATSTSATPSLPFKINAPGGADQWWVKNTTNYVFATPPSGLALRVGLTNENKKMLSEHDGWWDLGGFTCEVTQDPPVCIIAITDLGDVAPGKGYYLYLTSSNDPNTIIGVSAKFAIEAPGSPKAEQFTITVKDSASGLSYMTAEPSGNGSKATSGALLSRTSSWVPAAAALLALAVMV